MSRVPDQKRRQVRIKRVMGYLIVAGMFIVSVGITVELASRARTSVNAFATFYFTILATFMALIGVTCSWLAARNLMTGQQISGLFHIPPPVTSSTVPADEILVRGAAEPAAPQETLLRAVQKAEHSKADELLRSMEEKVGKGSVGM